MKRTFPIIFFLALSLYSGESATTLSRELLDYLKRPEAQTRVLDGALLICKQAHPELDVSAERQGIAALASELKKSATGNVKQQAEALASLLFTQQNFGLPEKDTSAAFLLSDVMLFKRGNCLGLSVLSLALAEESGLKLYGVPVPSRTSGPGHLLVRFDDGSTRRNFDPTEKGAEHPDSHYQAEFKLTPEEIRAGYVLSNAKKRDVLAVLLVNLGGSYIEERRAAEAVPLLEAALAIRANPATHSNLAAAKLLLGETPAAEKNYTAALKLDPKFFPARIGMADIAVKKGDPRAAKLVADLLATEPDNVQARTLEASVALQHNDLRGALVAMKKLSTLAPNDATVWSNLGKINLAAGHPLDAELNYRQSLKLYDQSAEAHFGLGKALQATGHPSEAQAEFEAALKIDPNHAASKAARTEPAKPNDADKVTIGSKAKPVEYPRGTIVLPFRIEANRIFVTARLNDKQDVEAIVDTGAEVTILNIARVKLGGLRPAGATESLYGDMVGRVPVQFVALDSLKLGDLTLKDLTIGKTNQGPRSKLEAIDFLIGMDVLSKMRFSLDFEQSALIIWPGTTKPPAPTPEFERITLPLTKPAGAGPLRPFVTATINQKFPATFLIDTGADAPMLVVFKKPTELGFPLRAGSSGVIRTSSGATPLEMPVHETSFTSLEFGKAAFKDIEGRVVDASAIVSPVQRSDLTFLNVIGTPFLKTLAAMYVDVGAKTVSFDRRK